MKKLTKIQKEDLFMLQDSVSRETAVKESKKYFDGGDMEATNFLNKYALRDQEGNYYEKTPDDMHQRLAGAFAEAESKFPDGMSQNSIYDLLKDFDGPIPQGSVMSAVRNPFQLMSTANCFVCRETDDDSYGNILKVDEELVQLMKRRGGVGTDLSHLRPRKSPVQNAARTSTGAASFAHRYSDTTREVAQLNRRGALMLTLDCRHPDLEEYINLKTDEGAVTGANISVKFRDDFMEAVYNNKTYTLRFPVDATPEEAEITEEVDAAKIFSLFVRNNYGPDGIQGAEPGAIWIDQIHRESIPANYPGFKEISTNPCVTGDTKVWVADGRGAVDFKTLVDQEKDIPVYTKLDNGNIGIKTMRNPRVTGTNEPVYKVTIENGHSFKATANHKFLTNNNGYVSVENLEPGESLHIGTSHYGSLSETFGIDGGSREDYNLIGSTSQKKLKTEHRLIHGFYNEEDVMKNEVIHHKDFDSKNNDPDNLIAMNREDHIELHRQGMIGEDNPYHRMSDEWKKRFAGDSSGEKNGHWCGVTNQELREIGIDLAKNFGRRFSKKEWQNYADNHNLPKVLNGKYRSTDQYSNVTEFGTWCAQQADVSQFNNVDTRVVDTFFRMIRQGYVTEIRELGENHHKVYVEKTCEHCGSTFMKHHQQREVSYCSLSCTQKQRVADGKMKKAIENTQNTYKQKAAKTRKDQLDVFTSLAFDLGRDPYMYEWKRECKNRGIPKRLRTKYGFDNYTDLKEHAMAYNHRVQSVEYIGEETVYNGTVDDTHNFYIGDWDEDGQKVFINSLNCGEIPLPDADSCRLLAINLYGYVENPFTEDAYFDFDRFYEEVRKSQRIMDDIVEIELNHISWIIEKVKNDPEDSVVKQRELNLWNRIFDKCRDGRRTGLGTTALGDALAALGIRYGSDESIQKADEIYKTLKHAAYRESVELAKERGPFPIWDPELEKDNPYLNRLREEDPELYADMQKYGRRNIAILTNAPTGTVSTLSQTSSGIENVFMPYYYRKRKLNHDEDGVEPDYVDETGDRWVEFPVFHHKLNTWFEAQGIDDPQNIPKDKLDDYIKQSPYHGATVADVDWRNKVRLQAAIQKHIDHSISVTTNLPQDVDLETVHDLYQISHKTGCKGCTIYREGSRDAVLSNESVKDGGQSEGIAHNDAPERSETLPCDIHRIRYSGDNWKILVGFMDDHPYEVFAFKTGGESGNTVRFTDSSGGKVDTAIIRKYGNGVYDLESNDGKVIVENIANYAPDDAARSMTRMISLSLRHGARLEYVIEQLEKAKGSIVSFSKAVLRALREYVDGPTNENYVDCKDAGMDCEGGGQVIYEEGCFKCLDCGSSRCG